MGSRFALTAEEDFIFGVRMRGDTLCLGPSGTRVAVAVAAGLGLVAMGSLLLLVPGSSPMRINGQVSSNPHAQTGAGLALLVASVVIMVRTLAFGIRADASGVVMRSFWRKVRVGWDEVADIRGYETEPQRWGASVGPNGAGWYLRPVSSFSVGELVCTDGRQIALPGVEAVARSEGFSMGGATAAELKIAALRRFAGSHGWQPRPTAPLAGASRRIDWWGIVRDPTWILVGWIGLSWLQGGLAGPVMPIAAVVVLAVAARKQLRRR